MYDFFGTVDIDLEPANHDNADRNGPMLFGSPRMEEVDMVCPRLAWNGTDA